MNPDSAARTLPFHWKIGIGFAIGLLLGLAANWLAPGAAWVQAFSSYLTTPLSSLFLNLIFMLIVPLIFSALVMGVAEMGDIRTLGHIGWKSLAWTVVMSTIAVLVGLLLVNVLKPGAGIDQTLAQQLLAENAQRSQAIVASVDKQPGGMTVLLNMVPPNVLAAASDNANILSLMLFALLFAIGMMLSPADKVATLQKSIEGLYEISMTLINWVIRLAPVAVACFMFNLAAMFGVDLLIKLGAFVGVVVLALAIHMFLSYGLMLKIAGFSPLLFFKGTQEATLMAFSTASSNATLPTALRVAEQMNVPPKVARFVLTVGASANQNGTALFEGVTVIFLAQFFQVDLTLSQQFMVMVVCILGGIGTAGVPSGSLPVIAMICAMVGVNPVGIGLILGVNHFLDMCRTALNVTGDLALATLVAGKPAANAGLPPSNQESMK